MYDLLLQVANPALIIAMVSSLIFFLIEIFYRGPHVIRLNLIMALFTAATVLISRISIEAGKERAAMFAAGLGIATLATTSVIVEFEYQQFAALEQVVIIALIVTIMWVSNRLVWDCTLLGRTRDVSAMGLTEVIRQKFVPAKKSSSKKAKAKKEDGFNFFEFMLGRNGKNSTPGLWVFYLAVAAFPIFGFGQWFVSPNTSGFSVFLLFAVYLTSGLGLLMVTSLLGLKRYVNKRGITVPEPIAMNWLFVGSLFLLGLLLLISFLPRPDFSSTMNDYLVLLGNETKTAEVALGDDNEVPDEPNADVKPNAKPKQENKQAAEDAPKADGKKGDANDPNSSEKKDGDGGEKTGKKSGKKSKNDKAKNDPSEKKQGKQKDSGDDQPQGEKNKQDPAKRKPNQENADQKNAKGDPDGNQKKNPKAPDNPDKDKAGKKKAKQGANQQGAAPPPAPRLTPDPDKFRWLVYLLVAAIFIAIGVMYGAELMKWWRQLSGKTKKEAPAETAEAEQKTLQRPKPFSSFADPFASGAARKWPQDKLMQYSFEALRAWATEHGVDTTLHLTAEELVSEAGSKTGGSLKEFSVIFNQTIYGNTPLSKAQLETLSQIWQFMRRNTRSAVASAG